MEQSKYMTFFDRIRLLKTVHPNLAEALDLIFKAGEACIQEERNIAWSYLMEITGGRSKYLNISHGNENYYVKVSANIINKKELSDDTMVMYISADLFPNYDKFTKNINQ